MTEAEWLACVDTESMLHFIRDRANVRKMRLLGCAACRQIWDFVLEEVCQRAVEAAEQFADSLTSLEALEFACDGAIHVADLADSEPESDHYDPQLAFHVAMAAFRVSVPPPLQLNTLLMLFRNCDHAKTSQARSTHTDLLRDIFGNPFRPVVIFSPSWRTSTAVTLASQMYESRDFSAMPILADALQDAGCDSADVLDHCRGPGPHVRGCWVVDLVLGKV